MAPTSGTIPTGIQPGYPTDVDEISPLVITTLAPDPIPFTGCAVMFLDQLSPN